MKTKHTYPPATITLMALMFILSLALTSCFKEDTSLCPRPFYVFIKVEDNNGNDITSEGDVKQLIMFVFDENGKLIDAIVVSGDQVAGRKPIEMKFDPRQHPQSLTFDVWANTGNEVDFSAINTVEKRENLYLSLKKMADGSAQSPGDLFHGTLANVPIEVGGIEYGTSHEVVIKRKVALVTITTINLRPWHSNTTRLLSGIQTRVTDGYSYQVHGATDGLDHQGSPTADATYHVPETMFNEQDHFVAPLFTVLPTPDGGSMQVQIHFNNEAIYTATADRNGNPFVARSGETLNILIELSVDINNNPRVDIRTMVTEWNVAYQWIRF